MTVTVISTNNVVAGNAATLTGNASLILAPTTTYGSSGAAGVTNVALATGIQAVIHGTLFGDSAGLLLAAGSGMVNRGSVVISATGSVNATLSAVSFLGTANKVVNHGAITGYDGVVFSSVYTGGLSVLFNHGTITALDDAISRGTTSDIETLLIRNFGTMIGGSNAIEAQSGSGVEQVFNRGLIQGDVELFGGDDLFDNRGGEVWSGIDLGSGNDTFRPGAGEEEVSGFTGTDWLDFSAGPALVLDLAGGRVATGWAAGDTYIGFENVIGSALRGDLLAGNPGANVLQGLGGNDTLEGDDGVDVLQGGLGNDRLIGGAGADQLTGGGGNDAFVILAKAEAGDVISDFGRVNGNDDVMVLEGSAFGFASATGKVAASRFVTRADNAAQDADDRLIFRTTDRSLWFDADGKGGAGAVLLVDLQAGLTLTAADIVLI